MLNLVGSPRSIKTRGPTIGKKLAAKISGMGSRFRITSIVGGRRPLHPHESSYLVSQVGHFIRNELPTFPLWKQHVDTPSQFESLVHNLHVSHASPGNDKLFHIDLSHFL